MAIDSEDRCFWVSERIPAFGYSAAICLRCGKRMNIRSNKQLDDAPCGYLLKEAEKKAMTRDGDNNA